MGLGLLTLTLLFIRPQQNRQNRQTFSLLVAGCGLRLHRASVAGPPESLLRRMLPQFFAPPHRINRFQPPIALANSAQSVSWRSSHPAETSAAASHAVAEAEGSRCAGFGGVALLEFRQHGWPDVERRALNFSVGHLVNTNQLHMAWAFGKGARDLFVVDHHVANHGAAE